MTDGAIRVRRGGPDDQEAIRRLLKASFRDNPKAGADIAPIGTFRRLIVPLTADWMGARLHLPSSAVRPLVRFLTPRRTAVTANEVQSTPDDIDVLWTALMPRFPFGLLKESLWWRWRYDGHPRSPYRYFAVRTDGELTGIAVIAAVDPARPGVVPVLELFARAQDDAAALVRTIAGECAGQGALVFMTPGSCGWREIARWGGFKMIPILMDRDRIRLHVVDRVGERDDLEGEPWAATWGDMDHV